MACALRRDQPDLHQATGSGDLKNISSGKTISRKLLGKGKGVGAAGTDGWRVTDVPSMRMLMNSICIALSGLLSPNIVLSVINVSAAAAVLSWKARKF